MQAADLRLAVIRGAGAGRGLAFTTGADGRTELQLLTWESSHEVRSIVWSFALPFAGAMSITEARSMVYTDTSHFYEPRDCDWDHFSAADVMGDTGQELFFGGYGDGMLILSPPFPEGASPVTDGRPQVHDVIGFSWPASASVADYDDDGEPDLAISWSDTGSEPRYPWFEGIDGGMAIFEGPVDYHEGDPDDPDPVATYDVSRWDDPRQAVPFGSRSGGWSVLTPDLTGDGVSDVLMNGGCWKDIAPFEHRGPLSQYNGGYALFAGGAPGYHVLGEQRLVAYGVCDPASLGQYRPIVAGDLTGDGVPDVLSVSVSAIVPGRTSDPGVLWVMSRLGATSGLRSWTEVSDAVVVAHDRHVYQEPVTPDLDGDGVADLVFAELGGAGPSGVLRVFFGPLRGFLDGGEADLTVVHPDGASIDWGLTMVAGDVDGDGVPDVVVGDQSTANGAGAVDVLSGAAIVAAAGRLPVPR